jgi:hypothetical protein
MDFDGGSDNLWCRVKAVHNGESLTKNARNGCDVCHPWGDFSPFWKNSFLTAKNAKKSHKGR